MEMITRLRVVDTKLAQIEEDLKKQAVYMAVTKDCVDNTKARNQELVSETQVYQRKQINLSKQLE